MKNSAASSFARDSLSLVIVGVLSVACGLTVGSLGVSATIIDTARFLAIGTILLVGATALLLARSLRREGSCLRRVNFIWFVLLLGEALFVREGTPDTARSGLFTSAAYGEAVLWSLLLLAVMGPFVVTPHRLLVLVRGSGRWAAAFTLMAIGSSIGAPMPLYSIAWAMKLVVIVLLLELAKEGWSRSEDVVGFLRVNAWGFLLLGIAPLLVMLVDEQAAFSGARLGGVYAPTGVSSASGMALLGFLTLRSLERTRVHAVLVGAASILVLLGGGKAAIVATLIATASFFLILGRMTSVLGVLAYATITALGVFTLVPALMRYFLDYFGGSLFVTLTGRTELWAAGLAAVAEQPLLGHGYLASKFVFGELPGLTWAAGHMHNAFLEVLYNNGLLGLGILLVMLTSAVLNLRYMEERGQQSFDRRLLAGLLSVLVFLLVNGLVTGAFGGRPHCAFMMFLAVQTVSASFVVGGAGVMGGTWERG